MKRWHELHDKGAAVVDEHMRKVDEAKELVAAFDEEERRREADWTAWRTCRAIATQTVSGSPTTWPVWPVWLSPLVIGSVSSKAWWKHHAGGGGSGGGGGGSGGGESDAAWRNCAVRWAGWSSVGSLTSRSRS